MRAVLSGESLLFQTDRKVRHLLVYFIPLSSLDFFSSFSVIMCLICIFHPEGTLFKSGSWVFRAFVSMHVQPCPTLCDPMDCSSPGSSVQGILQARTLKWVAISFSTVSSQPRDRIHVSCISCTGRRILHLSLDWLGVGE